MSIYRFTQKEIDDEIKSLNKIDVKVHLFTQKDIESIKKAKENINNIEENQNKCFNLWNKNLPCKNCVCLRAFNDKSDYFKIESLNGKFYQVHARYIEVDGLPQIMEIITQVDEYFVNELKVKTVLGDDSNAYYDKIYKDVLTGALNRRYYEENIKNRILDCKIAVIDINNFKFYNDIYGHNIGDAILVEVVSVFKRTIRKNDTIIRYGGDEFLIIFDSIKKEDFDNVIKRLKENISSLKINNSNEIDLNISIVGAHVNNKIVCEELKKVESKLIKMKTNKNKKSNENGALKVSKPTILIADKTNGNIKILTEMLKDEFEFCKVSNEKDAKRILNQFGTGISAILYSYSLIEDNNFSFLSFLINNHYNEDIPLIMLIKDRTEMSIKNAYENGATEYIAEPFRKEIVLGKILSSIKVYSRQKQLVSVLIKEMKEKERNNRIMINILSHIVEFRSGENGPHVIHVSEITKLLGEKLVNISDKYNLKREDIELISLASSLHDIGKIGIDSSILNKPGKLTKEEFEIVKTHCKIGGDIIKQLGVKEPLLKYAYEICSWHHEKYDGNGYPDRLRGEQIPISAQIVSMADCYDALVSDRCYKKGYPHDVALKMLKNGECGQFNPLLLLCLDETKDSINALYKK